MAKKIPIPKVKSKKMGFLDKLYMGIAGLSPFTGRARLHQSMSKATESGRAARAAQRADMIRRYGKGAMRVGRTAGLMNPWSAIPLALTYAAKHAVGSALEPYKNQDVEDTGFFFDNRGISKEGSARLLRERLAREDLYKRVTKAREEGVGFWERARMRSNPDDFYESTPNIDRASQLSDKDFHGRGEEGKWFNFNEGGIARLL